MKFSDAATQFEAIRELLKANNLIKDSYVSVLSAVLSTLKNQAKTEQPKE